MSTKKKLAPSKKTKAATKKIKPTSKKAVSKKVTTISKNDEKLLNQTIEIVQNLNSEISKVQKAKEKLQQDVDKLGKKVNTKPKNSKLKQELIKEFTPIFEKLNPQAIKSELNEEINSIFEVELEKVKSQIKSKTSKTSRDVNKKVNEIEGKLLETLKSNNKLKSELKKLSKDKIDEEIFVEIEKKIIDQLKQSMTKVSISETKTKEELNNLKSETSSIKQAYEKLQSELKTLSKDKAGDFSVIESKLNNLEKENHGLRSLIEKYEDKLYSREKEEVFEVENKVKGILEQAQSNLVKIKKEEESHAQFLVDKVNEIVENVNSFEKELQKQETKAISQIKKEVSTSFKETRKKVLEDLKSKDLDYKKDLNDFKTQSALHIKNLITELNSEFKHLKKTIEFFDKDKGSTIEFQKKEHELIKKSLNDQIQNFTKEVLQKEKELVTLIHNNKSALEEKVEEKSIEYQKEIKEDFARKLVKDNEFLTKIKTDFKEYKRELNENLENRFVNSKTQYDNKFKSHLENFEKELKSKEKDFLNKLSVVETERVQVLEDMNRFKEDMSVLTKEYVQKLDDELKNIKSSEANFEKSKTAFIGHIDELTQEKKAELKDTTNELKTKITTVLEEQKETFNRHENTFREVFNQKVTSLHDYSKNRLDKIEKKFVEKNLKYVTKELDSHIEPIKLLEDSINAKAELIEKNIELVNQKEEAIAADMLSHEHNLKEKVEERLTNSEKHLNKRFLEIDTQFGEFKSIVIDEVEDLIKEVDTLVNNKVEEVSVSLNKLNFANSEISKKINQFDELKNKIEFSFQEVRDELNDLRVKAEISSPKTVDMNTLVQSMSDYEEGLINLVTSLKNRGINNSEIQKALLQKGHPRLYIKMVLDNYNSIKH